MHLAACNKGLTKWCWWCKLRREVIMCIRALYSLPIGCVLFHLQTSKHGRTCNLPSPWTEHLARLSFLNVQYPCTDFAAHRLSGMIRCLSKESLSEAHGPILAYLSCRKMEERHRLLRKGVISFHSPLHPYPQSCHWEKSNPASPAGSEPQATSERFCPAPWGWTAWGWAVIAWRTEVNIWGQMYDETIRAFFPRSSQTCWEIFSMSKIRHFEKNPKISCWAVSSASVFSDSEPKWQIAFGFLLLHFKEEQSKKMQIAQETEFPWEIIFFSFSGQCVPCG